MLYGMINFFMCDFNYLNSYSFPDERSVANDAKPDSYLLETPKMKLAPIASCETLCETSDLLGEIAESSESSDSADELAMTTAAITITTTPTMFESANNNGEKHVSFDFTTTESSTDPADDDIILDVPKSILSSTETLTSSQPSPHNLSTSVSSDTLVPGSPCSLSNVPLRSLKPVHLKFGFQRKCVSSPDGTPDTNQLDALALSPATSPKFRCAHSPVRTRSSFPDTVPSPVLVRHHGSPKLPRAPSPISYSFSSPNIITSLAKSRSGKLALWIYQMFSWGYQHLKETDSEQTKHVALFTMYMYQFWNV